MSGAYIWLWIILANAAAIVALTWVGGSTSAMTSRDQRSSEDDRVMQGRDSTARVAPAAERDRVAAGRDDRSPPGQGRV